jgi:two-component system phosphate regulon sensor histidine kinase PhoR
VSVERVQSPGDVLAVLAEQLEHGVCLVDSEGIVRYANAAAHPLMTLDADCTGRRLADACRDYRLVRAAVSCLELQRTVRRELPDVRLERKLIASVVPVEGGACMLVRDESRTVRLEAMRRDFVANVSHELRTPLAAIQLLVETLQQGALRDGDAAADFVNKIGLEVHHMVQMVEELLELSTIESGRRPLSLAETSIDDVLRGIERLKPLARKRGVALEVQSTDALPHLNADAPRLAQAIRNLVHNAIKFTPGGGRIEVEAAPGAPGRVILRCTDSGVGIAPDDLPRIFERFWKADSSRQRDGEGSGLGLAIVRHVVEAHGGTVTAVSEPKRGAAFTVELPAA